MLGIDFVSLAAIPVKIANQNILILLPTVFLN
jgi:hypothetical protein